MHQTLAFQNLLDGWIQAFAKDLEEIFTDLETLSAQVTVSTGAPGQGVAASVAFDDTQMNRLLLQVCKKLVNANPPPTRQVCYCTSSCTSIAHHLYNY